MKRSDRRRAQLRSSLAVLCALGCGGDEQARGRAGGDGPEATAGESPRDAGRAADAGSPRPDASVVTSVPTDTSGACVQVSADTDRLPVHLAFAFDVSGSMGKGDEKWHDKALKWDPVVRATRAFFEADAPADQATPGLSASLTFFPADDDKCDADSYEQPDVAMSPLPSPAFGAAISELEPESEDDWRGGTPTLAALRGTRAALEQYRTTHPGRYAIVLVSDGYPQGCDDEDDEIAAVVKEAALTREAGISTYVIGVANPKIDDAPDTVSNLGQIAVAGGTERAYLIDTGDPTATTAAFDSAIARIRAQTFSCSLAIPQAPDGRAFDKRKVSVRALQKGRSETLRYDAACTAANGWRYDDEANPGEIVLCPATCSAIEAEPGGRVTLEFACEDVLYL